MELVKEWFRVWEDKPGIWVIEEPLHSEVVKSYLVIGSVQSALIDTGMGVGNIKALAETITDLPIRVLQSHAHNDHVGGTWLFDDVSIHESEASDLAKGQSAQRLKNWFDDSEMSGPLPSGFDVDGYAIPGRAADHYLVDGERIDLGEIVLEVLHLPGHSRGGLAFLDRARRNLFSTDIVYLRELYLLNPDSSVTEYVASLERLDALVGHVDRLYPSHGPSPIDPDVIPEMLAGMREIQAGRKPDRVDQRPSIEGGVESVPAREELRIHDFGRFLVLVSSAAKP